MFKRAEIEFVTTRPYPDANYRVKFYGPVWLARLTARWDGKRVYIPFVWLYRLAWKISNTTMWAQAIVDDPAYGWYRATFLE